MGITNVGLAGRQGARVAQHIRDPGRLEQVPIRTPRDEHACVCRQARGGENGGCADMLVRPLLGLPWLPH